MSEFKPGDIVRLKSGGPDMTVDNKNDDCDAFDCVWFHDGRITGASISGAALKHVRPFAGILSEVPGVVRVVEGGA